MFFRLSAFIFRCSIRQAVIALLYAQLMGSAFELALFANNGCYSHDLMLREVGASFEAMLHDGSIQNGTKFRQIFANSSVNSPVVADNEHRIYWVQMFMYDFGFGRQLRRPSHWHNVMMESAQLDADSRTFMERGSRLLWETTVPLDHNRPWNWRGALFLYEVIRRNQQNCEHFVQSVAFRKFLGENRVDLVVVDHFLQECLTAAASLLNASATIQFSNWPIADGYITALNIPAPPSAYPKTSTSFSAGEMRSFPVRLQNSLFHALISFVRLLQRRMVARFFASIKMFQRRPAVRLEQAESAHLFYAGRAEFIVEPVRPISNRIKHFGCGNCESETTNIWHQQKVRESGMEQKGNNIEKGALLLERETPAKNVTIPSLRGGTTCKNSVEENVAGAKPHLPLVYPKIRQQFALINWDEMDTHRFVLVSFGSIAKVEFMPDALLYIFLHAFANFPSLIFLWQTNSEPTAILGGKKRQNLPKNVRIVRWAPIKTLLAHPNLHYAILHGGVNTINEALIYSGKPILGIPLQGDQPSNLQRLVDLRMAVQLDIGQVWEGQLISKMALIGQNYAKYGSRAQQIGAMVRSYRLGIGAAQQNFWFRWVANKPFLKRTAHKFFHIRYRTSIEYFALPELCSTLAFLFSICLFLTP